MTVLRDREEELYRSVDSGQIAILRTVSGIVQRTILHSLVERLGELALVLATAQDAESFQMRSRSLRECHGGGVIIIPNFGQLLTEPWGRQVHANLYHLCVNSDDASAFGLLLAMHPRDPISRLPFPGSPLADRANVVIEAPVLNETELYELLLPILSDHAECCLESLGGVAALATDSELKNWNSEETTELILIRAVSQLSIRGHERLLRVITAKRGTPYRSAEDDELTGLTILRDGNVFPSPPVERLFVAHWLYGSNEGWPRTWIDSVRRFSVRVQGQRDVFWVDRYLSQHIEMVTKFLSAVVKRGGPISLRILSADDVSDIQRQEFRHAQHRWTATGNRIDWRKMDRCDIGPLHARQLLSGNSVDGWHLPPSDRLLCLVPIGNEGDSYKSGAPRAPVEEAWNRATTL